MDGIALRSALCSSRFADIRVVDSIDSTNRALLAWAVAGQDSAGLPVGDGSVLIARSQTAGRGRLGRAWIAPPDTALLMTAAIDPSTLPIERWPLLSFAMGMALAEQATVHGVRATLKWPNDVVITDTSAPSGYRKLAGILAESHMSERQRFVVVGIGVNLRRPAELDPALGPDAVPTWFDDHAPLASAESFTVDVLGSFEQFVALLTVDANAFVEQYRKSCSTLGQTVAADLGPRRVTGTAVDVDECGHLIVEESTATAMNRHVLSAGDVVHLRPAAP